MAALTNAEWAVLHPAFPNLVRASTLKTAPEDPQYNCIRFALGTPGLWVDPPADQPTFEALFHAAGWVTCPFATGTADGWALGGVMTHGSRFTTAWESKLGEYIRISHVRNQLGSIPPPNSIYGNIAVSFNKPGGYGAESAASTVQVTGSESDPASDIAASFTSTITVSDEMVKVDRVVTILKNAHPVRDDVFEQKYAAWKNTWYTGVMAEMQSSADRAKGKEWDALVALGAGVLPQVVSKLKLSTDLFAVQLYNKLQTNPAKKVPKSDIANYYYLDAQAKAILRLYGSTIATFEEHVVAWRAHRDATKLSSRSTDYLKHPSFDAIVAMGNDQVMPLVMAQYAEEQDGWWHELLHELEHGRKSGANTFNKRELYQQWKNRFEAPVVGRAA